MKLLIITFLTLVSPKIVELLSPPPDYRDAYCGNYTCKRKYQYLTDAGALTGTTTNYTVTVSKNVADSLLNITTQEGEFIAKLRSNNFAHLTRRFFGKLANDSIYLDFIPSMGPTAFNYIGKK